MHPRLTVVDHPLAARHLAVLRDRATPSPTFRAVLSDVSMLLLYEALRDLRVDDRTVETPLEPAPARRLADDIVVVAIMRAGLGMVDGALRLVPEARVGHLGVYRDEEALQPVNYYESLPPALGGSEVVVVDPMLATGGSAVHALDVVERHGPARTRLVCLVAAPEGLQALATAHPDVPVTVAAVDDKLDERGYIRPGLGDAGDRLFGTTAV
jgi:uracil phosphoribosyltransferase